MNSSALKNACVIRWNRPGGVRADRHAHDHVADLRHRRVGDHALDVGLRRARSWPAISSVAQPTIAPTSGGGRRQLEQRVHARDQVHARGDHRRGVDQRARRASGPPSRRAATCAAGSAPTSRTRRPAAAGSRRRGRRRCGRTRAAPCVERLEEVERAGVLEDEVRPEHQPDVADHVDHERLDARAASRSCAGTRTRSAGRTRRRRTPSRRSAAGSCPPGPAAASRRRRSSGTRSSARSPGPRPGRRSSTGGSASRLPLTIRIMNTDSGSTRIATSPFTPTVFA